MKTRPGTESAAAIGIDANGIYGIAEFQRRLGLGRHWLRSARRAGLVVHRWGGRSFVTGADFLAFIATVRETAGVAE